MATLFESYVIYLVSKTLAPLIKSLLLFESYVIYLVNIQFKDIE